MKSNKKRIKRLERLAILQHIYAPQEKARIIAQITKEHG